MLEVTGCPLSVLTDFDFPVVVSMEPEETQLYINCKNTAMPQIKVAS